MDGLEDKICRSCGGTGTESYEHHGVCSRCGAQIRYGRGRNQKEIVVQGMNHDEVSKVARELMQDHEKNLRVPKAGSAPATAQPQAVTYNIYGQNARVNNNSVDHSTNVITGSQQDNEALSALIDVLRSALERDEVLGETSDELKAELTTLQAQASLSKPKWQVIKATAGSIKAVLENAAGSMLATQALPYLVHLLK